MVRGPSVYDQPAYEVRARDGGGGWEARRQIGVISLPDPCLVVLVGAAGSGKSTLAARLFDPDAILSSDAHRALVAGDETDQARHEDGVLDPPPAARAAPRRAAHDGRRRDERHRLRAARRWSGGPRRRAFRRSRSCSRWSRRIVCARNADAAGPDRARVGGRRGSSRTWSARCAATASTAEGFAAVHVVRTAARARRARRSMGSARRRPRDEHDREAGRGDPRGVDGRDPLAQHQRREDRRSRPGRATARIAAIASGPMAIARQVRRGRRHVDDADADERRPEAARDAPRLARERATHAAIDERST